MISAIILAAGQSTRMGLPKMLLPWGRVTIIEHVVSVFANAGIKDILVITGGAREQVEEIIQKRSLYAPVRAVYNNDYQTESMLSSIQCGLKQLSEKNIGAALLGLGDQPQAQVSSVRLVAETFLKTQSPLVVPSFEMRRGHPWLVARPLWSELLEMNASETSRDFLNRHAHDIHYVPVDTPSILADMDTPEDYRLSRP